jgi:hypothetical protein
MPAGSGTPDRVPDERPHEEHDTRHEHGELLVPASPIDRRAFDEIREAIWRAVGDKRATASRFDRLVAELESQTDGLDFLAGLARQLVFGDQTALALFVRELGRDGDNAVQERIPAPERESLIVERGHDEPSFTDFDPIVDLHVGAAYAALGAELSARELLDVIVDRVTDSVSAVDYLHLQAQRFNANRLTRDAFAALLEGFGRQKPRIPRFDECMGALSGVVTNAGSALARSFQAVTVDPNTRRISAVQPATVCSGEVITLVADATNPFDPTPPTGVRVFFSPCGQMGTIESWAPAQIVVRVPETAETGNVSLGTDVAPATALEIEEAREADFQALHDACPLIGAGRGANLLRGFYDRLPASICRDAVAPAEEATRVTIRHPPRVNWLLALDQGGQVLEQREVEPCSRIRLQWDARSIDPPTTLALVSDRAQLASGPLAGTIEVEARPSYTLTVTNNCGRASRTLSLNLSPPVLRLSPGDVVLRSGETGSLTISVSCPVTSDTLITLRSSDPTRVIVPPSATITKGNRDVAVSVTGNQAGSPLNPTAFLSASAPGHLPAAASVWVENPLGEWQLLAPAFDLDMVAIHAALLSSSEVLFFAGDEVHYNDMTRAETRRWDPATALTETPLFPNPRNLFCGAQCVLPDGRVFVAGGHAYMLPDFNNPGDFRHLGSDRDVHTYSRASDTWTRHVSMDLSRWYPTCVLLPSGNVLIVSGYMTGVPPNPSASPLPLVNPWFDLFDPRTGTLSTAPNRRFLGVGDTLDLYPFLKVLPGGVLFVHTRDRTRLFFPDTSPTPGPLGLTLSPEIYQQRSRNTRTYPSQGACVILPLRAAAQPQLVRILTVGGASDTTTQIGPSIDATDTAEIFDFIPGLPPTTRQPGWRFVNSRMTRLRFMSDAVLLADGKVLIAGGAGRGRCDWSDRPVLQSELFDPETETFRPMASQTVERRYHAVCLLLPDGRVVSAGGTIGWPQPPITIGAPPYSPVHQVEIFFPPYLYRGPRPRLLTVPNTVSYGETFDIGVEDQPNISAVALIRPGAVTHTNDMDQRYLRLVIGSRSERRLSVAAPPDATFAPPGYYMLVVLNARDVPSEAKFIRLG